MSQLDLSVVPQSGTAVLLTLKITASTGATARIGALRRHSINFIGSANFCRPRS
jgi:hypothetical protein